MKRFLYKFIRSLVETNSYVFNFPGIAHNKVLAKLVGGVNKPDDQTVIAPGSALLLLKHDLRVTSIPGEVQFFNMISGLPVYQVRLSSLT